jgi:hypothetical protein
MSSNNLAISSNNLAMSSKSASKIVEIKTPTKNERKKDGVISTCQKIV